MANRKLGVWMSPALESIIVDREDQASLSQRLSAVAARYSAICRAHTPELSEAEWNALRDALNGYWMLDDDLLSLRGIPLEIADADRLDGLGAKWNIDADVLVRKLDAMDTATLVAVVESVEAWWATTS